MTGKDDLRRWLIEALRVQGGRATIVDVCRHVWKEHKDEPESSGDLFFTWQYDIRWIATQLRKKGVMRAVASSESGIWELVQL